MSREMLMYEFNRIKKNKGYKRHFNLVEKDLRKWFDRVGIDNFTNEAQINKMREELFETEEALASGDVLDTTLEIADIGVVWLGLCFMNDINPTDALELAYFKIKDRVGKTENGSFKKEKL